MLQPHIFLILFMCFISSQHTGGGDFLFIFMVQVNCVRSQIFSCKSWMRCSVYAHVQIEQVSQLSSLVESQLQYHRQAVQVLEVLFDKLRDRCGNKTNTNILHIWMCGFLFSLLVLSRGTSNILLFLVATFKKNKPLSICFCLNRMNDAQSRPRREYTPKPKPIFDFGDDNHSNGGYTSSMALPPSRNSGKKQLNGSKSSFPSICEHHIL